MGLSLFQTSTLGMKSQAHALNTIGTNIANISTGGFKRTDTRFVTMLSGEIRTTPGQNSTVSFASQDKSLGGVRPIDFQIIDQQGLLQSTERDLDLAIAGDGFFQVSPTQDISGEILFTRDGSFEINFAGAEVSAIGIDGSTISVREGFLTDKNGFFVLGITPQADGTFSESSSLQALRVDQFAIPNSSQQTTTAKLSVNLPANKKSGEPNENTSLTIIDSNGKVRALTVSFIKLPEIDLSTTPPSKTANRWRLEFSGDNLTSSTQTSGTLADPLIFSGDAILTSALSTTIGLVWDNGATNSFTMDLTDTTQFASDFLLFGFSQNGLSSSSLEKITFDEKGHVIGNFKDGSSRKIYKIPLATFSNPNGLELRNGNVFAESGKSGAARSVFADTSGVALLLVNTVELSNVELASQFTQMIRVQQAYNSSATVFKIIDEMLQGARDLKT